MNSFSHYAFGAVMEWGYRVLAGIDTAGPGYRRIVIRPRPPTAGSNPEQTPIHWVQAHYDSINGRIASAWKLEGGVALASAKIAGLRSVTRAGDALQVEVASGTYRFAVRATP